MIRFVAFAALCTVLLLTKECKAEFIQENAQLANCTNPIDNMGSPICHINATCTGSYCVCNYGLTGNGSYCTDVDECVSGSHPCGPNDTCVNTDGSYSCITCIEPFCGGPYPNSSFVTPPTPNCSGFTCNCSYGDLTETFKSDACNPTYPCSMVKHCKSDGFFHCQCKINDTINFESPSDLNSTLPCNTIISHVNQTGQCSCRTGFVKAGKMCFDIDECLTNPCHTNAMCNNTAGSYQCDCKSGYTGNGSYCTDINECSTNPCHSNAGCNNTAGSYQCSCQPGFSGNGTHCSDMKVANSTNQCHSNASCSNTVGSYQCSCNRGFSGSGRSCEDLNECELGTHNCHSTYGQCTNRIGSFQCSCKAGYSGDGVSCQAIDQCVGMTNDCDTNAKCNNTGNSYICTCNVGYDGDGKTCKKQYLREFSQNITSSSLNKNQLETELTKTLLQAFQYQNGNVKRVIIVNISRPFVKYWVQYVDGPQADSLFLDSYVKYRAIKQMPLNGLPRITSCERNSARGYTFPEIAVNKLSYSIEMCPRGYSEASIRCIPLVSVTTNGVLHTSQFDDNSLASVACGKKIEDIKINVSAPTQESVEQAASSLQIITSGTTPLSQEEVQQSFAVVTSISTAVETGAVQVSESLLVNVVVATSHVAHSIGEQQPPNQNTASVGTKNETSTTRRVVESLSLLAHKIIFNNKTISVLEIKTRLIAIKVEEHVKSDKSKSVWFAPEEDEVDVTDGTVFPMNISVPGSVVSEAFAEANGSKLRTVFFLHKGDALFPSQRKVDFIISAEVGSGTTLTNLNSPVLITNAKENSRYGETKATQGLKVLRVRQQCAYWDFNTASWKTDGCGLDGSSQPPVCKCNHLTNFALIVSTVEVPRDVALSYISDIGCGLSIVGFFLTIALHVLNRELLRKLPNQINLHVFCNLLVAYLVFLAGIGATDNPEACTAVAALMQFTFLSSWMWMAVYSNKLYEAFVKVFHSDNKNYLIKACVFAYGVPLLITVINLSVTLGYYDKQQRNPDFYDQDDPEYLRSTYRAENMCWLQGNSLYFGFLLIVGLVFINNVVIFVLVLRKVIFEREKIQSTAAQQSKLNQLIMAISLSFTLGLTWVFGFLMLLSTDVTYNLVMSWFFALFNAFQGVFVFYITCVKRKDMLHFWWDPIQSKMRLLIGRINVAIGREPATYDVSISLATQSTAASTANSGYSISGV